MGDSKTAPLPTKSKRLTFYALGSNGNFQLGLPHNEDTDRPQKCIFNISQTPSSPSMPTNPPKKQLYIPLNPAESIKDMQAGGNHTLLLTTHGRVFAAGSNEHGQLALLPPVSSTSATGMTSSHVANIDISTITGFHLLPWTGPHPSLPISHLAATFTATALISSHTTLYTAGYGPKGELGLGPSHTHFAVPTHVFDIRDTEGPNAQIQTMKACMDHILLLSSAGIVYGTGSSRKGQLGDSLTDSNNGTGICWKVTPTTIHFDVPFQISQLATGRDFTIVAGHREGQVKAFGKGSGDFNLSPECAAISETSNVFSEEERRAKDHDVHIDMIQVHAGWSSVTVQHRSIRSDHLTGWLMREPVSTGASSHKGGARRSRGTQDRGQLPPKDITGVVALAVGSEHSVAIVWDDGRSKVVSWGWGEHGNCGSPVDERGVVGGGRWNVLFDQDEDLGEVYPGAVCGVGAGCGSSFFWVEEEQH